MQAAASPAFLSSHHSRNGPEGLGNSQRKQQRHGVTQTAKGSVRFV